MQMTFAIWILQSNSVQYKNKLICLTYPFKTNKKVLEEKSADKNPHINIFHYIYLINICLRFFYLN